MAKIGRQFRFHNAVTSMNYVAIYNNVPKCCYNFEFIVKLLLTNDIIRYNYR